MFVQHCCFKVSIRAEISPRLRSFMWNTHSLVNYSCLVSLYKLKNISETLETETSEGKSAAWLSVFHVILHLLVGKKKATRGFHT